MTINVAEGVQEVGIFPCKYLQPEEVVQREFLSCIIPVRETDNIGQLQQVITEES